MNYPPLYRPDVLPWPCGDDILSRAGGNRSAGVRNGRESTGGEGRGDWQAGYITPKRAREIRDRVSVLGARVLARAIQGEDVGDVDER